MPDIMTGHVRWRVWGATGAPVHIPPRRRVKRGGAHLLLSSEKASDESIRYRRNLCCIYIPLGTQETQT